MNADTQKLLLELRQTKTEIEHSLAAKKEKNWLTAILEDELADVNKALFKMAEGNFGYCEISGELLPTEFLTAIPTIRSIKDTERIENFLKKPI